MRCKSYVMVSNVVGIQLLLIIIQEAIRDACVLHMMHNLCHGALVDTVTECSKIYSFLTEWCTPRSERYGR